MLRIGICDDVYDARLVLRSALERILERRHVEGRFFEFSSGEGLLRWLESHAGELDLVFLDMEMGELDGMETARRLRAAAAGLQLVFVTGYAEHVFDGYSVGALGYLLKPPKAEQLEEVLETLTIREKRVLELRFGLEDGRSRTLEEVGQHFGVTRERIRQIEAKALRKLRHPSRSKKLKDFLE